MNPDKREKKEIQTGIQTEDKKKKPWVIRNLDTVLLVTLVAWAFSLAMLSGGVGADNVQPAEETGEIYQGDLAGLVEELNASGWRVCGASWCGYCQDQKEILGPAVELVFIDCDDPENVELLTQYEIREIPAWVNLETGEKILGVQTPEMLEELVKKV